ncbi:MAG: carboxypeptidase regulatory-like domain-containing protein [Bacteroidota bacterium]
MNKSLLSKIIVLLFVFVGSIHAVNAQVTTSTLTGTVKDAKGALPGAGVKATHTPTGTVYSSTTSADGGFTIVNMRVGGPYTVEVTYIGYQGEKVTDLFLKLGEPFVLNTTLNDNANQLTEVVVTGTKDANFNSKRVGPSTSVSKEQLQNLPTLSRSLNDFTRLTPQASGSINGGSGQSFSGTNNRYNSISIDGAVNNDVFGLAANGAPGGQAATQPISLDAIQEIQIVLSPYDVSNGNFAGAGINAVTRSGTNKFEGSAYFFGRNENSIGKSPDAARLKATEFYNTQYGFRLGGPIIQNKLFFFVNGELGRVQQPTTFNVGDPGALLTATDAQSIVNTLNTRYGYNPGSFDVTNTATHSDKVFARLDWNINAKNQLTLRHNYIKAYDDNLSRSATSFRFGSNLYRFNDQQNNSVLELRSSISDKLSNNLIIGYSRIRDTRAYEGQLFPQIRINNISGISTNSVFLGSEASSTANELDQDVFEFTDNFKIFANKHTFTIGTHNEFFKFRNLFMNNFAGAYVYNNLADFTNNAKPNTAASTYSIIPGDTRPAARFTAAQLGFYFQDEIDVFTGFKLVAGLRADVPIINDTPPANALVASTFAFQKTDQVPSGRILVSPRVGFNWDLTGDRSIQLRGGTALLTSRAPYVWLSNQFTNNGMLTANINATNNTGTFIADPANQKAAGGTVGTTYEVNLANPNLKMPQLFRSNMAADFKLPLGIMATLEGIYSKTINNILYSNLNLKNAVGRINPNLSAGNDTRPLYNYPLAAGKVNATFTNAFYLDNTSKGDSYSLTAQLQKAFGMGLYATAAYTYGEANDVNSGTSSTASSNTNFVQTLTGPNNPPLAISNFDIRHRVIGSLNYTINYGKQKASGTTLSLFYQGRTGTPFTYLYEGDLNQDGATGNDLFYVPRNLSEIKLADIPATTVGGVTTPLVPVATQWANLDKFISNDPYLSKIRGQYTERNGARMPWENMFDLRIMQTLGAVIKGSKNNIQLSFDIFNVGNLINKDWGKSYFLGNQASTIVRYNYNATTGGTYNFTPPANADNKAYSVSSFTSRWQGQVGLRYNFN